MTKAVLPLSHGTPPNCVQFVSVALENRRWSLPEMLGQATTISLVCFAIATAGAEFASKGFVPHLASRTLEAPSSSASPSGGKPDARKRTSHASGKPLPSRSWPLGNVSPVNGGLLV